MTKESDSTKGSASIQHTVNPLLTYDVSEMVRVVVEWIERSVSWVREREDFDSPTSLRPHSFSQQSNDTPSRTDLEFIYIFWCARLQ